MRHRAGGGGEGGWGCGRGGDEGVGGGGVAFQFRVVVFLKQKPDGGARSVSPEPFCI